MLPRTPEALLAQAGGRGIAWGGIAPRHLVNAAPGRARGSRALRPCRSPLSPQGSNATVAFLLELCPKSCGACGANAATKNVVRGLAPLPAIASTISPPTITRGVLAPERGRSRVRACARQMLGNVFLFLNCFCMASYLVLQRHFIFGRAAAPPLHTDQSDHLTRTNTRPSLV